SWVQVTRSPSRRQRTARPSRLAQTETMPGVASQPNRYSSSACRIASSDKSGLPPTVGSTANSSTRASLFYHSKEVTFVPLYPLSFPHMYERHTSVYDRILALEDERNEKQR